MALTYHQLGGKVEASEWLARANDAYAAKSSIMYGELGVLATEKLLAEARDLIQAAD